MFSTDITRAENLHFSDANYSIKYNTNILLYNILQIDVYLRFQNLKKIENWFTNEGAIVIFVRCVFSKLGYNPG